MQQKSLYYFEKWKDKRSGTCCSTSYVSHTRDLKRFTISEMATDSHERMILHRTMRPSVARVSEQLDPRFAIADIPPPQSTSLGLHSAARKLIILNLFLKFIFSNTKISASFFFVFSVSHLCLILVYNILLKVNDNLKVCSWSWADYSTVRPTLLLFHPVSLFTESQAHCCTN